MVIATKKMTKLRNGYQGQNVWKICQKIMHGSGHCPMVIVRLLNFMVIFNGDLHDVDGDSQGDCQAVDGDLHDVDGDCQDVDVVDGGVQVQVCSSA